MDVFNGLIIKANQLGTYIVTFFKLALSITGSVFFVVLFAKLGFDLAMFTYNAFHSFFFPETLPNTTEIIFTVDDSIKNEPAAPHSEVVDADKNLKNVSPKKDSIWDDLSLGDVADIVLTLCLAIIFIVTKGP